MRNDKMFPDNNIQGVFKLPFVLKGRHSVIEVSGPDSVDLLNRLSTNRLVGAVAGDVVETILTTDKGRVLDVLLVLVKDTGLTLIGTKFMQDRVLEWLDKYTIMEDVKYTLLTEAVEVYSVIGSPASDSGHGKPWHWERGALGMESVLSLNHESIRGSGKMFLVPMEQYQDFEASMSASDSQAISVSESDYRLWRIMHTIPEVGYELTEQVNPLEAGAKAAVDFDKGCYIGQEVIARLDSYDKVQRQLVRIEFDDPAPAHVGPGTIVTSDGKNAGFLTTVEFNPIKGVAVGLACIRHAFAESGTTLTVQIEDNSRTFHVV